MTPTHHSLVRLSAPLQSKTTKLESQLANVHKEMEKYLRDFDNLAQRAQAVQKELDDEKGRGVKQMERIMDLEKELKARQDLIAQQTQDIGRLEKAFELEKKKVAKLTEKVRARRAQLLPVGGGGQAVAVASIRTRCGVAPLSVT